MQVIPSYAIFLLSLFTIKQYAGVHAQGQHSDELTQQLLEIDGLEITTTPLNLLDEIEAAMLKKQQFEHEIQQQQEKLRQLQEQYEKELQVQQRKQQELELQRQHAREQEKQRLRQYAVQQKLQERQEYQQTERQQYKPNTEVDFVDNASESNFYEHHNDGTYAFGYALPNGVRRFERSIYSAELAVMLVEGFYAEIRDRGTHKEYELHCYRSGPYGYRPMPVRAIYHAPLVRRNTTLDDDCFDN